MNTALDVFFGTTDPVLIVIYLFRMVGYFFLFGKCLVKPYFALIPFVNSYYLGVCAKKEREGRILLIVEILEMIARVLLLIVGPRKEVFVYLGMGLSLALVIAEIIFRMRIWRGLCKVFGRKRRWLFLWFFAEGLTALLWGLKDEFQMKEEDEDAAGEASDGHLSDDRGELRYYRSRVMELRRNADKDFVERISKAGRLGQVGACIWRLFKAVIFDNDWMVFPLSAIIIGVIAYIVSDDLFLTMEGTLKGTYAIVILAIWNGCFHSLQAVVRDRKALLEAKRVGIHYTSYILAQMFYQGLLCLGQTALLLYIFTAVGIRFPEKGIFTDWFSFELGLTVFLVTYAADMLGLLISSIAPSKSGAMTTMPFILIAQFVLAGGILALPEWAWPIQDLMPSHYGVTAIGTQGDYNSLPMVTGWNVLNSLRDYEVGGTITVQEILDYLSGEGKNEKAKSAEAKNTEAKNIEGENAEVKNAEVKNTEAENTEAKNTEAKNVEGERAEANSAEGKNIEAENAEAKSPEKKSGENENSILVKMRKTPIIGKMSVREIFDLLRTNENLEAFRQKKILSLFTVDEVFDLLYEIGAVDAVGDYKIGTDVTFGDVLDYLRKNPDLEKLRKNSLTIRMTVGQIIDAIGEDQIRELLLTKTAEAARVDEFEKSSKTLSRCWIRLFLFALIYAGITLLAIEIVCRGVFKDYDSIAEM